MKMPTERSLTMLAARVARDFKRPIPNVRFVNENHNAQCRFADGEIDMPTRAWVLEHRATEPMGYRLLMLHEMAHWVGFGDGHSSKFYTRLFALCFLYRVPLSYAYDDEVTYMPRSARSGLNRFLRMALTSTAGEIVEEAAA